VQQAPDEIEGSFTLLAERYERRSVMITSNLVFNGWRQIFKNPMTTAVAIDRLVHHSVILEAAVPSYRTERVGKPTEPPPGSKSGPKAKKKVKRCVTRDPPPWWRHLWPGAVAGIHLGSATGKSSCRRPARIVVVDQPSLSPEVAGGRASFGRPPPGRLPETSVCLPMRGSEVSESRKACIGPVDKAHVLRES